MSNIVLVHGGWHGGWAWREVADILTGRGHRVFAPTLTGLGERSHLVHADITPDDHVEDIVNVLRYEELDDVVLVGHSYGGFIITGAASQMADKVAGLVYLDAFVPTESNQSAFSIGTKERADEVRASMTDGYLVPATGFERWVADAERKDWLRRMVTPQPIRCFSEGPTLTGAERKIAHKLYLLCARHDPSPFQRFFETYSADPDWQCARLDCLHNAMMEKPNETAEWIDRLVLQATPHEVAH